uniref:Protein phosphatase 1 regulatory subunit 1B n=1 Tax=Electrophorus electricus TaxID=8005 RepID=A0A4W4HL13_ELEEL
METSGPGDVPVRAKEKKKIQFAAPSTAPTQLDPRQVEMIRRRRPTPATLFRVADQSSPEDDNSTHQWVVGENGVLKPKRVNPNVYQPPSLKAVQQMAEAQMQKLGVYAHMEEEGEESLETLEEEQLLNCPTGKHHHTYRLMSLPCTHRPHRPMSLPRTHRPHRIMSLPHTHRPMSLPCTHR